MNANRFLIIVAVMSATLMQVLDMTIVNVALPHMQGSLGAAPDQISWTLTCYLIASAIFMPLTGYFSDILGRKKYLLCSILGFTLSSMLCGAAQSLEQIIVFRLLQGVFGAGLVPLSQAILADVYPKEEMGKAMAIWGMGVMVGPILGPTLGGYLTEIANWRWTFYVNVPVGIFAFLIAWKVVPTAAIKKRHMDWAGLALISLAIGALQYFLDRGNQEDWFNSRSIVLALVIAVVSLLGFLVHSIKKSSAAVFDLSIFKNRNFTVSSLMLIALGLGIFGVLVLQPLFLENLLNYPVLTTGLVMAPRGICTMLSMIVVSKIGNRIDQRILICIGMIFNIFGMAAGTYYNQNIDLFWVMVPMLLQGVGMGLIFVPLSVLAFSTLPQSARIEAAGLYSLLRTMGSSIGIATTLTLYTRYSQVAWNQLGGFIHPFNRNVVTYLGSIHKHLYDPQSIQIIAHEVGRQAQVLTFVNIYAFIMWSFILMLPFVFLLSSPKQSNVIFAQGD
jgi:MFS transporter, DHA2 family, multidrug resistance protein